MSGSPASSVKPHFWSLSHLKLRFRSSSLEQIVKDQPPTPTSPEVFEDALENQKDGFYRYSEIDEEKDFREKMTERSSAGKYSSGLDSGCYMESDNCSRRRSRPYKVSCDEWVLSVPPNTLRYSLSPSPKVLSLNGLDQTQWINGFQDVLKIFCTIYAMAKIVHVCFLGYGADLDDAPSGLLYWIERAENQIRTNSLAELIGIVENLFYTLYARVMLELAGTELCSLFPITDRPITKNSLYYLPSPCHMYRILLAFKDILDSPSICEHVHHELMSQYLESYIRRLICSDARRGPPQSDDALGYYQHALAIASNRESDFRHKWDSLIDCFADFPPHTVASLSARYLTVLPRAYPPVETATADLPFVNLKCIPEATWETILILDHRYSALAQLESRTVGEQRRADPECDLLNDARYCRCICKSNCSCAKECSYDVERACPCSEWQLRLQIVIRRESDGGHEFATRVNTIAVAAFQGLNFLKRELSDASFAEAAKEIFALIEIEVQKERSYGEVVPCISASP